MTTLRLMCALVACNNVMAHALTVETHRATALRAGAVERAVTTASTARHSATALRAGAVEDCDHAGIDAFAAVQFDDVKQSLGTFLKFWLMGAPVRGWQALGEMKAAHALSGATAEIFVDLDAQRVGVVGEDGGDLGKIVQLSVFSHKLFDELLDIAGTPEVEPKDRLCYPPAAVEAARAELPLPKMSDE